MNKQLQLERVFESLVDLVLKMADRNNAEYDPAGIPALVEQIFNLYSNVH